MFPPLLKFVSKKRGGQSEQGGEGKRSKEVEKGGSEAHCIVPTEEA